MTKTKVAPFYLEQGVLR